MSVGTVENLDRGVIGTQATIEKMHKLVALGKLDPTFQKIATWIRLQVPADRRGSTQDTADAVFDWVQQHGVFQRDPFQIEKIEEPIEAMRAVVQARQAGTYSGPGLFSGDCDTYAVVTATLLGILGFQYAFETAKVDADRPDEFSHVWTAALVDGNWYPLDASTAGATPGWRPPVTPDLFARWPEQPIENVVKGGDMSAWNVRNRGLGEVDTVRGASPLDNIQAQYPQDYVGYGIPHDFGDGPGVIPPGNFEDVQLLTPHDTAIPSTDLDPDIHGIQAAPTLNPSERLQSIMGQPNDHGNPYYRDTPKQPYVKVNAQPYPPGSPWNGKVGMDSVRYVRTGAYVKVKSPETPERKVEVRMGQPMLLRRRTVMTTPQGPLPYGMSHVRRRGLGQTDTSGADSSGFVTSLPTDTSSTPAEDLGPASQPVTAAQLAAQGQANTVPDPSMVTALPGYDPNATPGSPGSATVTPTGAASTPKQQAAAQAGSNVWGSISSVFGALGSAAPSIMQSSAMKSILGMTNKLAGKNVVGVGVVPWYLNPFVLGGGLLVVGGGAYLIMKERPGSGGTRRRRR